MERNWSLRECANITLFPGSPIIPEPRPYDAVEEDTCQNPFITGAGFTDKSKDSLGITILIGNFSSSIVAGVTTPEEETRTFSEENCSDLLIFD